jgi:hypothetical protein
MSHFQGLNVTKGTTAYVKQQREVTATHALEWPCHPEKQQHAHKYPLLISSENKLSLMDSCNMKWYFSL